MGKEVAIATSFFWSRRMWQIIASALFSLALSTETHAFESVNIHYHQRPPFYFHQRNGTPSGLVAGPIVLAVERAHMAVTYVETPAKRQMALLTQNRSRDCAIGWFKTPQREAVLHFSTPVYQDKRFVLVVRKNEPRIPTSPSLNQVFQSQLIWLKKSAYSYGRAIDEFSLSFSPKQELSSMENIGLLRMLAYKRADYLLMAPEELADLLANNPTLKTQIEYRDLSDISAGEHRYLVCSKSVEPEWIARIDVELNKLTATKTIP